MHEAAFCVVVVWPLGQAVHPWSAIWVPALDTYCPALQIDQLAQATALLAEVNVPLGQLLQTASVVLVPAGEAYRPGPQLVHGVQAAAFVVVE
jgi:hypothetical protein